MHASGGLINNQKQKHFLSTNFGNKYYLIAPSNKVPSHATAEEPKQLKVTHANIIDHMHNTYSSTVLYKFNYVQVVIASSNSSPYTYLQTSEPSWKAISVQCYSVT